MNGLPAIDRRAVLFGQTAASIEQTAKTASGGR